jgi:hypothetical protein
VRFWRGLKLCFKMVLWFSQDEGAVASDPTAFLVFFSAVA